MKPPDLPTIPEKDFVTLTQWAKDYFVVLRATCEMWKAIAIRSEVTHFLLHQLTRSGCGAVTRGHVPAGNRSSFGPRLEALVSHLTGFYRFSKRKIKATLLGCWIRFSGSPLVWVWCGIFRHGPLVPLKREWLRSMARS